MASAPPVPSRPFPFQPESLEDACAVAPGDMAALLLFALSRRPEADARPVLMAAPRAWLGEHGRPYGPGLGDCPLILTPVATVAETLWVLEQALRSGAVSLAVGAVDGATLTQSRRLEFAAKQGGSTGLIAPRDLDGLSAARRRWRVSTGASAIHSDDLRSPGRARLTVELARSRGERPGVWMLEQDDETHRLRLADRLADLGPPSFGRADGRSGLAA